MWKWSELKRILGLTKQLDTAELGAVMWPIGYPPNIDPEFVPDNGHITVVMFRDINDPDLGFGLEDVMAAVAESVWEVLLWVKVEGLEYFGENNDVPVLRVSHDYLTVYRDSLIKVLRARGIEVDMTFPDYKPHVTINAMAALNEVWPERIMAGPVEVWWGNKHYKMDDYAGTREWEIL